MEPTNYKLTNLKNALATLESSIQLLDECESGLIREDKSEYLSRIAIGLRDSMIQRFEYSVDSFWKFLKFYLENYEKFDLVLNSPRGVIRQTVEAKLLSESEGNEAVSMVDSRNQTSHIYRQEIAELISVDVPKYYAFMIDVVGRIEQNILKYSDVKK